MRRPTDCGVSGVSGLAVLRTVTALTAGSATAGGVSSADTQLYMIESSNMIINIYYYIVVNLISYHPLHISFTVCTFVLL